MLMYQFKAPHRPWQPAEEFQSLFTDGDLPQPANFNDDFKGREAAKDQWMEIENHMNRRDLKISPPEGLSRRELNDYYAFGNSQLPKEQIELFAPDIAMKMDNFRDLEIFKGGKSTKLKNSNQDKGFKDEFKALKAAVEKGELAISFDEMYSTSKVTFAILNALKTGQPQEI